MASISLEKALPFKLGFLRIALGIYSSTKRAISPLLICFQYIEFGLISKAFQPFGATGGKGLKGSGQEHFISAVPEAGRPLLLKLEIRVMVLPTLIQFRGYYFFFF